jgi:hypothetical protein
MRPTRPRSTSPAARPGLRALALAGLVLLAGCYRNVPIDTTPREAGQPVQLRSAHITARGQEQILYSVSVRTDSVVGYERLTEAGQPAGERIAYGRSEVTAIEKRQINVISIIIPVAALVGFALTLKDGVLPGSD